MTKNSIHWIDIQHALEDSVQEFIPNMIDPGYSKYLDRVLSLEEIERALFSMKPNKSPGFDGLPIKFYQTMWKHIEDDFYMLYLKAFQNGSLGPVINKGIIKLIPKGKNEDTIASWCPITLLNTSYKIIVMALAIKIKPIVQMIVRVEQTGFLKGRYILDNLMLAWETMEWAQQSGQNDLIIKLDFDKAYDRICWSFILKMLQWLGFGPKIQKHVQMLFQDANAHLIVNKNMSDSFDFLRSIR